MEKPYYSGRLYHPGRPGLALQLLVHDFVRQPRAGKKCSEQKMAPQKEMSKLYLVFKMEFVLINVFLKYHYQQRRCGGPVWGRSRLGQQVANEQSAHTAQRHHCGSPA